MRRYLRRVKASYKSDMTRDGEALGWALLIGSGVVLFFVIVIVALLGYIHWIASRFQDNEAMGTLLGIAIPLVVAIITGAVLVHMSMEREDEHDADR